MTLRPEVRPSQPGNSRGVERGRVGKGKDRLAWPVWVLAGPGVQTPGRLVPTICRVAQPTAHFLWVWGRRWKAGRRKPEYLL